MQKEISRKASTCKELADVNSLMQKINLIKQRKQSSIAIIKRIKEQSLAKTCLHLRIPSKPFSDQDVVSNCIEEDHSKQSFGTLVEGLKKYIEQNPTINGEEDILAIHINWLVNMPIEDDFEYNSMVIKLSNVFRILEENLDNCNYLVMEYEPYVIRCLELIKGIQCIFYESEYKVRLAQVSTLFKEETKNINKQTNRPFIALDLDEALIHSESMSSYDPKTPQCDLEINELGLRIWMRPHLVSFLNFCKSCFDLYLFSAGNKMYTDTVLKQLGLDDYFLYKLDRRYCIKLCNLYIKDLTIFSEYCDGLLVDNNLLSFCMNLDQGFLISPFYYSSLDEELIDAEDFLKELLAECNSENQLIKVLNEDHFMLKKLFCKFLLCEQDFS